MKIHVPNKKFDRKKYKIKITFSLKQIEKLKKKILCL